MAALRTQAVTTGRRPLRSLAQGPWAVPLASGALIALAFAVRTWSATAFDLGLVAATLVAGRPIAQRALLDLRIRRIGIEALVTIAVLGAFAIGELWEAAAVTFLFALGGALERATIGRPRQALRSAEHTSELQSLMRISYAVFCLKKQ